MTKPRLLVVLVALNLLLWGRAMAHDSGLEGLEAEARKGCEKQGFRLRALMIRYDEMGNPEGASAVCGLPRLTSA